MEVDRTASILCEAVKSRKTKAGIKRYLSEYQQLTVNDEIVDKIISLVNDIRQMPVKYFEAKPRRAVSFDEVKAAVIPTDTENAVKEALKELGVPIYEYDSNDENSRAEVTQKAINTEYVDVNGEKHSDLLFQMRPNDDFLFDDLFDDDGIVEQSVFEKAVKDNPDNTLLAVYQHAAKTAETAITQSNDVRLDEKAYLKVARRIMQEYDISRKLNKDFDTELAEKIRMHIGRIENGVADFESELDSIVKDCQEALLLSGHLDYESKQDERDFVFGLINGKRLLVTKNGEAVIKEEYG